MIWDFALEQDEEHHRIPQTGDHGMGTDDIKGTHRRIL